MAVIEYDVAVEDELERIPTLTEEEALRRDVLRFAAKLIDEHGWIQGGLGAAGIGYCIVGAIKQAGLRYGDPRIQYNHMGGHYPYAAWVVGNEDPDGWNDILAVDDGKQRVTRCLRRLADGKTWNEAIA